MRVNPKTRPEPPRSHAWRQSGLTRRQRQIVDEQAAQISSSFRRRFYLKFSDILSRALLIRGGEISTAMVRNAAELACLSFPQAPGLPPAPSRSGPSPLAGPGEAAGAHPPKSPPGERTSDLPGCQHKANETGHFLTSNPSETGFGPFPCPEPVSEPLEALAQEGAQGALQGAFTAPETVELPHPSPHPETRSSPLPTGSGTPSTSGVTPDGGPGP
jgi:hypothetical protein